jgi:hypothetical protein
VRFKPRKCCFFNEARWALHAALMQHMRACARSSPQQKNGSLGESSCRTHHVGIVSSIQKAQGKSAAASILTPPQLTRLSLQALWRKNPQDEIDFLAAARGPDIVAIEQDKSASFILDTSPLTPRSSRLNRPLKSLSSIAPHPDAEAAAKIFSAGKSELQHWHGCSLAATLPSQSTATQTRLTRCTGKHRERNNRCVSCSRTIVITAR